MLSKNKLKLIRSLALKKHRDESGLFLVEGPKMVDELLGVFPCVLLAGTADYLSRHRGAEAEEVIEINDNELSRASQLKTPREVLALFRRPAPVPPASAVAAIDRGLCLALDGVQDPGNVGTILRIADWFGVEHIFCSPSTADVFAPKTVQATMGALARVQTHIVDLPTLLENLSPDTPVFATTLDGENFYSAALPTHGLIIMGNEGQGITPEVLAKVNRRLFIPPYPTDRPTSESLNVAIATAIVCAEFRRGLH